MKDKYKYPEAPQMSVTDSLHCSTALYLLNKYMGKYQISFQFWGECNNNVFIEKDGTDLYDSGGHETPYEALMDALDYLDRINNNYSRKINRK